MEIKILNSIIHKELRPWIFENKNSSSISSRLSKVGNLAPKFDTDLVSLLNVLLVDFPDLTKWLAKQTPKTPNKLVYHSFEIDLPEYNDIYTKFYKTIITSETLRFYNAFFFKVAQYTEKVDIVYHTSLALKSIKALLLDVVRELKSRDYDPIESNPSDLVSFVLSLLRRELTILYFDIQKVGIEHLEYPISIEDFYILELGLSKSLSTELKIVATVSNESSPNNLSEVLKSNVKKAKPSLSFGWKYDSDTKLESLFDDLIIEINFIDEEKSTSEDLVQLLTSKNIEPFTTKIFLGCKTTEFVFVIDNISKHFKALNPTNIEKSRSFWTKPQTNKEPTLITVDNFYKTRSKSNIKEETKALILEIINKYFP